MKRVFLVLAFAVLVFEGAYCQKIDSVQFKTLYDKLSESYTKNIDSYLIEIVESEVSPLPENASEEARLLRQATINEKLNTSRKIFRNLLEKNYKHLEKDLSLLGDHPREYLIGYSDMSISSNFPKVDKAFYKKNWKDVNRINSTDQL